MSVGELCNREVVVVGPDASILEAVKLMREHHVGDIVVVEQRPSEPVPVGILTDRDIVIEVLAEEVDPQSVSVRDVMSDSLVTAREDEDLLDIVGRMRLHGVRRVPVVNQQGGLEGIVTVDDILELLAEQMNGLAALVKVEQQRERERRAQP
jgi:CBS domain-containing protein